MAKVVEVRDAEATLRELLTVVASGDEVVLAENSKPVARLVPVQPAGRRRIANLHPGALVPTPDFDDPMPEEFWLGNRDEASL